MRPAPTSPHAWSPSPGPQTWTPRDLSVATLACVAAFAHIRRFIAGASAIGAAVARHRVVSRSSAWPVARRARKSAVAGAMITKSAQRASSMCDIAFSASGSHRSLRTSRPGHRLEGHRRHELARARGEHDLHFGALLAQAADEIGALVGGDAAGDAEKYAFAVHGPALSAGRARTLASRVWFRQLVPAVISDSRPLCSASAPTRRA